MTDGAPIWIVDSSSLITMRSRLRREVRQAVSAAMTDLVDERRLVFPREVVDELRRYAASTNPTLRWAESNEAATTGHAVTLEDVSRVVRAVPEVLDPDKDSGVEEGDPYV